MLKKLSAIFAGVIFSAGLALAASTINPTVPAQNAPLSSQPIRNNFAAAYNDINNVLGQFNSPTAPAAPSNFQYWLNTTSIPYVLSIYDGSTWLSTGQLNPTSHTWSPTGSYIGSPVAPAYGGTGQNFSAASGAVYFTAGTAHAGTVPAAYIPAPTASTLGGIESLTTASHYWINGITTAGVPVTAQPAFSDLTGTATTAQGGLGADNSAGTGVPLFATGVVTITGTSGTGNFARVSGASIAGATITTSTYNGNSWTTGTGTLAIGAGKTFTASNTLTLTGTDSTSMAFPSTSATIARTDAGQTFTGTQAFGAITYTTLNGNTWASGTGTLSIAAGKTLTASNTMTLAGTDSTVLTFPSTSATIARTDAGQTFTGTQAFGALTATSATVTSASATALTVGLTGATNPAFTVDASTGSQAAGLKVTGAATGGTVAVVATDSGSNTNLTVNAKGSGTIGIGSVSTGAVTITPATTITGALTNTAIAGSGTKCVQTNNSGVLAVASAGCNASGVRCSFTSQLTSAGGYSPASEKMAGFGATYTCTPTTTGAGIATFVCNGNTDLATTTRGFRGRYGTGAAPGFAAAASGTAMSNTLTVSQGTGTNTEAPPWTGSYYVSGLTPGTAYWFDIGATSNATIDAACQSFSFVEL